MAVTWLASAALFQQRVWRRLRALQSEQFLLQEQGQRELPLRLASYVFQDPESFKEKLLVAVEVDPPSGTGTADLMFAFVLVDADGKAITSGRERKIYNIHGGESARPGRRQQRRLQRHVDQIGDHAGIDQLRQRHVEHRARGFQ